MGTFRLVAVGAVDGHERASSHGHDGDYDEHDDEEDLEENEDEKMAVI